MNAPLRKVVEHLWTVEGFRRERLECGHIQNVKQDAFGPYYAAKRRCRRCAALNNSLGQQHE